MAGTITPTVIGHRARGVVKVGGAWTTHSDGSAPATIIGAAFGKLVAVGYKPGNSDTGIDLSVKDVDSGTEIFALGNAGTGARYIRPTGNVTGNDGASVSAHATAPNVNRDILVAGKISLTVAQGGSGKTGALYLVFDEGADPDPSQFA